MLSNFHSYKINLLITILINNSPTTTENVFMIDTQDVINLATILLEILHRISHLMKSK